MVPVITLGRPGHCLQDGLLWANTGIIANFRRIQTCGPTRSWPLDGSLGHFAEVLSGDYYEGFATSSPHQIWSAAMVVSPILRGLFGLQTDAENHQITLAPHVPADWTSFAVRNVHVGEARVDFQYHKTLESITLDATRTGTGDCWVEFSPAFSLRTEVVSVEMNGRPLPFKVRTEQRGSACFSALSGLWRAE